MSFPTTTPTPKERDRQTAVGGIANLRVAGADWSVREVWRERLLGAESPDWFDLEAEPRARRVKTGQDRRTWEVPLIGGTVFAKVLRAAGWKERIKWAIAGRPGRREWRVLLEAERRGVSMVHPLAVGVRSGRRPQSVLLTEGIDGVLPLPEAWRGVTARMVGGASRAMSQQMIGATADLLARAHERGLVHGDNHAGNILLAQSRERGWVGALVDVQTSRWSGDSLSVRESAEAIAQLDQYFQHCATRSERLRFVRCYLVLRPAWRTLPAEPGFKREFVTAVVAARRRQAVRLARRRDRRLGRNGKYFASLRWARGWRAKAAIQLERRHVFPECGVPDRSLGEWRVILPRIAEAVDRGDFVDAAINHAGVDIEVRQMSGLWEQLRSTVMGSIHVRTFEWCHRLRHRDRPAPLILACAEHRHRGLIDRTFLVRPRQIAPQEHMQATEGIHE